MIKTGSQHIATLKDGRQVYINGEVAGDVTEHSAFRRTIGTVGALYDFQSRPDNLDLMTFEVPGAEGQRANRIWKRMLADYEAPPLDLAIHEALRDFIARRKASMPDSEV